MLYVSNMYPEGANTGLSETKKGLQTAKSKLQRKRTPNVSINIHSGICASVAATFTSRACCLFSVADDYTYMKDN
jgi:hypothetical protein